MGKNGGSGTHENSSFHIVLNRSVRLRMTANEHVLFVGSDLLFPTVVGIMVSRAFSVVARAHIDMVDRSTSNLLSQM